MTTIPLKKWRAWAVCLVFLAISAAVAAKPASEGITLTYIPGSIHNTIMLKPVGQQEFFINPVHGVPCAEMRFKGEPKTWAWHLDVDDAIWFDKAADAILVVDYVATDKSLDWAAFDTGFYTYHNFVDPVFAQEKKTERFLEFGWLTETSVKETIIRRLYKVKRARFANGSFEGADIRLRPRWNGFIGLVKVSLHLTPLATGNPLPAISFDPILDYFFSHWLNRFPTPLERKMFGEKLTEGVFSLRNIMKSILRSWEFLERHLYPLERADAIRNLFRMTCGRWPSNHEINTNNFPPWGFSFADEMSGFVDRYYIEILEYIFGEIRKAKP